MNYIIALNFIYWAISIFMLTGFIIVRMFEKEAEKNNDNDAYNMRVEDFLHTYYSGNFINRVGSILFYGAKLWSAFFTEWYWKNRRN